MALAFTHVLSGMWVWAGLMSFGLKATFLHFLKTSLPFLKLLIVFPLPFIPVPNISLLCIEEFSIKCSFFSSVPAHENLCTKAPRH